MYKYPIMHTILLDIYPFVRLKKMANNFRSTGLGMPNHVMLQHQS